MPLTNDQHLKQLEPIMRDRVRCFLLKAQEKGFNLKITDSYRSPQQQQALYNQGRTAPGKIVTNAKGLPKCLSNHCKRRAIDVVDRNGGYNISWEKLGKIGESCGLEWGGRWKFKDQPHFQYLGSQPFVDGVQLPIMPDEDDVKDFFRLLKGLPGQTGVPTASQIANYTKQPWQVLAGDVSKTAVNAYRQTKKLLDADAQPLVRGIKYIAP